MRKKIIAILLLAAICLPLSGCNLINGDTRTMMRAPQPNNMQEQLAGAITDALGSNLIYVSPKSGKTNLRQSILLTDLDGDGTDEVMIFYKPEESSEAGDAAHIAMFREDEDGRWQQQKSIEGLSGEIDYIDLWDFDNNGTKDLLVGWSRGESSPRVLTAYDMDEGASPSPLFQEPYTESRFFESDSQFVFILNIADRTAGTGSAKIMAVQDGALKAVASCAVDGTGDSVQDIKYARVNSQEYAIILDIRRGNNMSTQFLFWGESGLSNPHMVDGALDPALVRETNFASMDIDKDGVVEIPSAWSLPVYPNLPEGNQMSVLTDWSTLNVLTANALGGAPVLKHDFYCVMNAAYGYYYIVPPEWVGKVTCYQARDNSMHFYYVGAAADAPEHMFSIYQMAEEDLADRLKLGNWYELRSDKDTLFVINMAEDMSEEAELLAGSVLDSRKNWIQYK